MGDLVVSLGLDTARFESDLGRANNIANKNIRSIGDGFEKLGKATALVATAAASGFAFMASRAIESADAMNKMAQSAGTTVDRFSKLAYAARLSDVSTQDLGTALKKLDNNMIDAASGTGSAVGAFKALGISVKNADGSMRDSSSVMRDVAGRFAEIEDGAAKTAIATDIFGKAGADLIPLLNSGSDGMDQMAAEASRLGLVIDQETAAKAETFNDNLTRLGAGMEGMVTQVTARMLPTFMNISEQMLKTATDTGFLEAAANGLSVMFKAVVTSGMIMSAGLRAIGDTVGNVAAAIVQAAQGNFREAWSIINDHEGLDTSMQETFHNIQNLWTETATVAVKSADVQQQAKKKIITYTPGLRDTKPKTEKEKRPEDVGPSADSYYSFIDQSRNRVEELRQSQMTERQLLVAAYTEKREMLVNAHETAFRSTAERNEMLLSLEHEHQEKIRALDADTAAQRKENVRSVVDWTGNALNTLSDKSSKAAKAGRALSKATSLAELYHTTPITAMKAFKAMAGIPYIGPALGAAASAAVYALGATAAGKIGSESSGGGGSGGVPAVAGITPVSEQKAATKTEVPQTTIIKIPEDRMVTGRQLVAFLDEALGDGAVLNNVRIMA